MIDGIISFIFGIYTGFILTSTFYYLISIKKGDKE